jgi:hypothetical protein
MEAPRIAIALSICALLGAALALGTVVPQAEVSAAEATAAIGSATADVGEEVSVNLQALGIPEPGLGAWTADVTYDPAVVSLVACQPHEGSVCGPQYRYDTDRITGASATGLPGDTILATMTYRCEAAGVGPLELDVSVFTGNTIGQEIDYAVANGSITCVEPSEPTATEQPTPSATPALILPDTGSGPRSGGRAGWLIAALGGAGLAVLGIAGALRPRKRLG